MTMTGNYLKVDVQGWDGASLEQVVDADISAFADYFCGELKNDSLSRPEVAILKTYLYFKTRVEPKRSTDGEALSVTHETDSGGKDNQENTGG